MLPPVDPRILEVSDASARARAASLIGKIISSRYRIDELLAMGGMGAVYRGEHVLMKKRIAIKILHPEVDQRRDLVKRFEREAFAGAHVQHPNVASATDFGKLEDGSHFLVLEYVRGPTLYDLMRTQTLSLRRAVRIGRQLAAALAAVHAKGIIHRDIKPRNVIVAAEDDLTKLIDFGFAKVDSKQLFVQRESRLDSDSRVTDPDARVTETGTVFGTVAYMAPEAALGMIAVEARSDLYALGLMLYEMLAGKHPFDGTNPIELFRQQRFDAPPAFKERAPTRVVPPIVEAIVMRLLEKNPEARFQTAQLLCEAIDAAMPAVEAAAPEPAQPSLDTAEFKRAKLAPPASPAPPDPPPSSRRPPTSARLATPPSAAPALDPWASATTELAPAPPDSAPAPPDSKDARVAPASPDPYSAGSLGGPSMTLLHAAAPSRPAPPLPRSRSIFYYFAFAALALAGIGVFELLTTHRGAPRGGTRPSSTHASPAAATLASAGSTAAPSLAPAATATTPGAAPTTIAAGPGARAATEPAAEQPPPSASSIAAPSASAPGSSAAAAFDAAGWRAVLRRSASRADWNNAKLALLALIEKAPEAFHEPPIAAAARETATAYGHAGGAGADEVFDALAGSLGSDGLDILYDMVAQRGGSVGAKRAEAILSRKDIFARASPELRVALSLRQVPCDAKLGLLDRAVAVGDERALIALQTFGLACFRRNKAIEDAIRELRAKLTRH